MDLRSDVLLTPTAAMWTAMKSARPGWSYMDEDNSVIELQRQVAGLLDQEAALLVPTCSMANLIALMSQADRGTQVILGATAHIVTSEALGVASICGAFPRLVQDDPGYPEPASVGAAIAETEARGLPSTSLLCLENSHNNAGGVPLRPEQTRPLTALARSHGIAVHVDGARLFNASVALHVALGQLIGDVDSVAVSLNKGLGAPYGAILAGNGQFVRAARANLKRLGGSSVHQAGRWATAALLALDGWPDRIAADHRRAALLAEVVAGSVGADVVARQPQTNIVLLDVGALGCRAVEFLARLADRGVRALAHSSFKIRLVTYTGIDDPAVEQAAAAICAVAAEIREEHRPLEIGEGRMTDEPRAS